MAYCEDMQKEQGREPRPEEYLGRLAVELDHRQWEQDKLSWHQMRQVLAAQTGVPLIARARPAVSSALIKELTKK
jgi:hypothetical protein